MPDSSTKPLVMAIDIGTSSVRVMVCDQQAKAIDQNLIQVRYQPDTTPDGGSTLDPAAMCDHVFQAIDQALQKAGSDAARIGTVAIDSFVANLMGLDKSGQPTTPIYTWADVRGALLAHDLADRLPPADYTQRTGCRLHTSYWPLRLEWLRANEPQRYGNTAYWLSFSEYLLMRLFEDRRTSVSVASWSGLFNRFTLDWDTETLAAVSIRREQLSALSAEPFSGLSGEWADRWPALKEAAWHPAIGDGVASNIGAGCTTPQRVALSGGTSGALRVIVPGTPQKAPDGLFVYRVDAQRSLVGGALSNVGNVYAWMQQTLNTSAVNGVDLKEAVANMQPDSHGLTILPFLAGERAPGWNDKAQAVFLGMTYDTTPAELVRACLEAIACRYYQIAKRLAPLLPNDAVYIANGAAVTNSPTWMQIIADVLDATVQATADPEATIRGAVYMATGSEVQPKIAHEYRPDPTRRDRYRAAAARQQALYEKLFT